MPLVLALENENNAVITGLGDGDICFLSSYFIELGQNSLLLLSVNQDEIHKISRIASGLELGEQDPESGWRSGTGSLVSVELAPDLHQWK